MGVVLGMLLVEELARPRLLLVPVGTICHLIRQTEAELWMLVEGLLWGQALFEEGGRTGLFERRRRK